MAYFFLFYYHQCSYLHCIKNKLKNKLGWTDFLSWIENYKATMASG